MNLENFISESRCVNSSLRFRAQSSELLLEALENGESLRDPLLLPGVLVGQEGVGSDQHLSPVS